MRLPVRVFLVLLLFPTPGSAQNPDAPARQEHEAVRREVSIPESAMKPSRIHVSRPVTEWPHAVAPEIPAELEVVRLLRQFSFEAGSKTLNREAQGSLVNTLQEDVKGNPAWHLLLVGSPDPEEASEMDLALAEARTRSVREFLVSHGISPKRLSEMILKEPPTVDEELYPLWTVSGGGVEIWAIAPVSDTK